MIRRITAGSRRRTADREFQRDDEQRDIAWSRVRERAGGHARSWKMARKVQ